MQSSGDFNSYCVIMAESTGKIRNEHEKILECSICMDTFADPLCLPCMHTFCAKCIKEYVQKSQTQENETKEFNCPTCRYRVDIPEGGVERLPKHLFVNNLKEVITLTSKSETKCDYCVSKGIETLATWRCIDCCISLCDKSKDAHDHVYGTSKPHQLLKIFDWKQSDISGICSQNKEFCSHHEKKSLKFYCSKCDTSICQTCHTLDHADHTCRDIAKVAEEMKHVIQESIKNIARLIKMKENDIKELIECNDRLTSCDDVTVKTIRDQKAIWLQYVTECFDVIEENVAVISNESRKIIDMSINSLKLDISSLENSNQMGKAIHRYGRNAEKVESSKRLLAIIKSQEESAIDMNKLKKSLNVMKFHVKELEIKEDSFGVSEKLPLFPELRAQDCDPQRQMVAPSLKKIRNQPELIARFHNEQQSSVTTISADGIDCFIAEHDGRVSLYNKDGKKIHDFRRPPEIKKWSPCRVNAYDGVEHPVVFVANNCSPADGGGVYVYTADGRFTGKTIRVDHSLAAAALDDRHVAVLVRDEGKCRGWVEVYDLETGTSNATSKGYNIANNAIRRISVSPVTREIIVTHDGGVTALSPADLTPRWEYHCRADGAGQLYQPGGVCVDQAGRVMVGDWIWERVVVLSEDGKFLTALSTDSFIKYGPHGLALTRHGQLVMNGKGHDGQYSIFIADYLEK